LEPLSRELRLLHDVRSTLQQLEVGERVDLGRELVECFVRYPFLEEPPAAVLADLDSMFRGLATPPTYS